MEEEIVSPLRRSLLSVPVFNGLSGAPREWIHERPLFSLSFCSAVVSGETVGPSLEKRLLAPRYGLLCPFPHSAFNPEKSPWKIECFLED